MAGQLCFHNGKLSETTLELWLKAWAHDSFQTKNIKPAVAVPPTPHVTQSCDPDSLERYAQLHKRLLFRPHCPLTDRKEQWSQHKWSVTECPQAVRTHTPQLHTSPVTTNARQTIGRTISTFHPRLLARFTFPVKAPGGLSTCGKNLLGESAFPACALLRPWRHLKPVREASGTHVAIVNNLCGLA